MKNKNVVRIKKNYVCLNLHGQSENFFHDLNQFEVLYYMNDNIIMDDIWNLVTKRN